MDNAPNAAGKSRAAPFSPWFPDIRRPNEFFHPWQENKYDCEKLWVRQREGHRAPGRYCDARGRANLPSGVRLSGTTVQKRVETGGRKNFAPHPAPKTSMIGFYIQPGGFQSRRSGAQHNSSRREAAGLHQNGGNSRLGIYCRWADDLRAACNREIHHVGCVR